MNQIFTHPGQPEMQAEVILASQGPDQKPIYTIRGRYPRPIHAEVETHRVMYIDGAVFEHVDCGFGVMSDQDLSRNARSSRAVPVKTMLQEIRDRPFIPWHWFKNQRGMQGTVPLNPSEVVKAREHWLACRDANVAAVEALFDPEGLDIHKQNPNRLLEPFSWIDTLITATEWDNFLWLRDHKDAEPHLQDFARLVKKAIFYAEVQQLAPGEWHLPYITEEDLGRRFGEPEDNLGWLRKISAARCARISYKPFDGDSSYERELARYDMLVTSDRVHASPTEHQATPDAVVHVHSSPQVAMSFDNNLVRGKSEYVREYWQRPELHGNLTGYIQARKLIPNEAYK